jgi:DNA-binding winged helix-turn-helix (wHTH) protein/tetratricopeptide (TPR) repeat protein
MEKRRFGVFELDVAAGELRRQGQLVRLQHQPLQLLVALVEQPGQVVTREELRRRLWPDGITVDFDQSLNKCVTKLRDALKDSAASPRFIETLPKRGYRFIADVGAGEPRVDTPSRRVPWVAMACGAIVLGVLALSASPERAAASRRASSERREAASPPGVTPIYAARDAYERGRVALSRRTAENLRAGVEQFQRAVQLSPRFADAHVGLADAWSLQASYGVVDPREGMPRARDAANRALMLNPALAGAHASLARTAMIFDLDWPTAEWHFARALAIEPGAATTQQWHAYLLSAQGRHDDAIAAAGRAIAADPRSLNTNTALGYVLYLARRYDQAAAQLTRTLEIDPGFSQARRDLALVRMQEGRIEEAVQGLARVAALNEHSPAALGELAWARGISGDRAEATRLLATLDRMREHVYVAPDTLALVYLGLGDRDQAINWLQHAATTKVAAMAHLAVEPMWDGLRADARFKTLAAALIED